MPANKDIEAVIFDLGRVLVQVDFSRILARFKGRADLSKLDFNRVTAQPWCRDFSRGRIDADHFYQQALSYVGLDIPKPAFKELWTGIFDVMPGMQELVAKTARYKNIGLLSDTDSWHWNYLLHTYPFLQQFKKPALSYKIGALKPHPLCYQRAAEYVDTPPERCLFIDDKPENIAGALSCGMQAWLFESGTRLYKQLISIIPEISADSSG